MLGMICDVYSEVNVYRYIVLVLTFTHIEGPELRNTHGPARQNCSLYLFIYDINYYDITIIHVHNCS